jgi:hypothetical protein
MLEEEKWGIVFNGYRVSDLQGESVCRVLHTNVNTLNTTEFSVKVVEMVLYVVCILNSMCKIVWSVGESEE